MAQSDPQQRILDAFEDAIVQYGVQAASFSRIATIGGFHRTLVQHHFGSRTRLVHAAVARLCTYYQRRTLEVLAAAPTQRRLETLLDWLLSSFGADGPPRPARAVDAFIAIAPTDTVIAQHLRQLYGGFRSALDTELREQHPSLSPTVRADLAFSWVCLAFGRAGLDTLEDPTARATTARRACDHLLTVALSRPSVVA